MNNNRIIRPLGPENIEDYLTIYLDSYPAFKDIGDEGRAAKRSVVLSSMEKDENIHFTGLFEDDELIATMKIIDFQMNISGKMKPATGLMALGVHPLHKKKGAALDMVKYFEDYTVRSGAVIALLLPFRIDFYKKMGYGFESRLYEYRLPTSALPECRDMADMRFLSSEDMDEILRCHAAYVRNNHGMIDKFPDEIRDMEEDTAIRRVGYIGHDGKTLRGYVAYHYESNSPVNYTLNRIEVSELTYDAPETLIHLLGFLRMQEDQDQEVVLRTGEEDFYHLLEDPADVSGNYVDFGCLQTNIATINVMHKIIDPKYFVSETGYRRFGPGHAVVRFRCADAFSGEEIYDIRFTDDSNHRFSNWSVAVDDDDPEVEICCSKGDMASLFMGSCSLAAMVRLGVMKVCDLSERSLSDNDTQLIESLDRRFHYMQKPFSNTDF